MKNILVTGAAGFIGSHLSERLLAEGFAVTGVDNFDAFYDRAAKERNLSVLRPRARFTFIEMDLAEAAEYAALPTDVAAVVHLAGKAGVRPSIADPASYLRANVTATSHLLEWMKAHDLKKYVFASSSSVYGNNKKTPFAEADNVDFPISPYASTKKACELINHTYYHLCGIDTVNLRFFTVYGPRQRPDLAIHKFTRLISAGETIPMFGDGSTARDYTFVADTVGGIVGALRYVLDHTGVYETVNLGNNQPVKLATLISTLYELMETEPRVEQMPMQPGDVNITYADISKAQRLFGYQPQTGLRAGLEAFIRWYREQQGVTSPS